MRQTTFLTVEHIVVASHRSYEQVKASLESRLGVAGSMDEVDPEITPIAQLVERKLEALVAEATGEGQG